MRRGVCLALCLALCLAACSSSSNPVDTPVGPNSSMAACNQAATEVSAALVNNEACLVDSDCALLTPPSCVSAGQFGSVGTNDVPVAATKLSALEHTFSVIEAEVCPQCGTGSTNPGNAISGNSVPLATCGAGGLCVATTGPAPPQPGVGSFEWDCTVGCGPQRFCDVETNEASAACPGWPGYWTIVAPGICASTVTSVSEMPCGTDFACGFQQSCQATHCGPGCTSFQPTNCDGDCQLLSDNHGCMICSCDAGCPPPPPDGG